jgi:antitoxin component HigA of HigAB toxin-antitoxin module
VEKGVVMKKSTNKLTFAGFPRDYAGLVGLLPPRPIHDKVDYQNTMEIVLAMAGHKLNRDQADYLKILSEMILQYDRLHDEPPKRGTVTERLQYLVEQANMSASDLGRLLGNRGLGSLLMTGKRSLSKAHIRQLSQHFSVSADYFL